MKLQAPFPWFGGKSKVAPVVWERFGDVATYVEPFFGSGATLLLRPHDIDGQIEIVNDLDCYIANFWRAVQSDPEAVAYWADNPENENDLHARHAWLTRKKHDEYRPKIEGDPEFFDPKAAGWWVWGICCWIGSGFCSGEGPWQQIDGQLLHLGNKGQGVNRKRLHLGDKGQGVNRKRSGLEEWMFALAERLEHVRACCGDWSRVCGPTPTVKVQHPCGVFLDPPYADTASRTKDLYSEDCLKVAHDVREWAIQHGNDSRYRICLAGYEGEHEMPESWDTFVWKASGGYGSQGSQGSLNANRERLWFSPHCRKLERTLF